jgi:hypothetical protein
MGEGFERDRVESAEQTIGGKINSSRKGGI